MHVQQFHQNKEGFYDHVGVYIFLAVVKHQVSEICLSERPTWPFLMLASVILVTCLGSKVWHFLKLSQGLNKLVYFTCHRP